MFKSFNSIFKFSLVTIFLVLFLYSCNKKEDPIIITKTDTVYISKPDVNQPNANNNFSQNSMTPQSQVTNSKQNATKIPDELNPQLNKPKKQKDAPNPYANANLSYKIIN